METNSLRAHVLHSLGANEAETEELLAYNENRFRFSLSDGQTLPLADEPFVQAWRSYAKEAESRGLFPVLQEKLVQLQFPIREGISGDESYRSATLKGILPLPEWNSELLHLDRPDLLTLQLYPTPAGTIPILISRYRDDFVKLVQAFTMRNEPRPVPQSQGAPGGRSCMEGRVSQPYSANAVVSRSVYIA